MQYTSVIPECLKQFYSLTIGANMFFATFLGCVVFLFIFILFGEMLQWSVLFLYLLHSISVCLTVIVLLYMPHKFGTCLQKCIYELLCCVSISVWSGLLVDLWVLRYKLTDIANYCPKFVVGFIFAFGGYLC